MGNAGRWKMIDDACRMVRSALVNYNQEISKAGEKCSINRTSTRLLWRMFRNLTAVSVLVRVALNHADSTFFKLPVGLLVRNCLMDGITGLNVVRGDEENCNKLLALSHRDYVLAMREQHEVYRDKLEDVMPDDLIRNNFVLQMEDTFLDTLDLNADFYADGLGWKVKAARDVYDGCKASDVKLKSLMEEVADDEEVGECVRKLYAYYKYFSQYEHYSECGNGDSIVPFGEDNVRFEKVFVHLGTCVELMVRNLREC